MSEYLVIGGTEKSGTTSVYLYLNSHPNVAGSLRKETDYFRRPPPWCAREYEAHFGRADAKRLRMEASPGYLAESVAVAPAMASIIPHARILFVLRDPIDRLLSGFVFHKSRFHIPQEISFDEYIELCRRFELGMVTPRETGLREWHLRVLEAGLYAKHLRDFYNHFEADQIKVCTFEGLQRNPRQLMWDVCLWSGLDGAFYTEFEFVRANVTFSPRHAWLQRAGLRLNAAMEPFFNRNPVIKRHLLSWYKKVNGVRAGPPRMSRKTAAFLVEYYSSDVADLLSLTGPELDTANNWLWKHDA